MYERGPWAILVKFRSWTGIEHYEDGNPMTRVGVLGCLWCTSVWVACVLMVVPLIVVAPFAISAGAILVERYSKWQ